MENIHSKWKTYTVKMENIHSKWKTYTVNGKHTQ